MPQPRSNQQTTHEENNMDEQTVMDPAPVKRTLLVTGGRKTFRITIPPDARVTFGPWSPPSDKGGRYGDEKAYRGTLRIYSAGTEAKASMLGVFTDVESFRDLSLVDYEERVTAQEVQTVWKSDRHGYRSEVVGKVTAEWADPVAELPASTEDAEAEF